MMDPWQSFALHVRNLMSISQMTGKRSTLHMLPVASHILYCETLAQGMSSSKHSSWMETSLLNICDIGPLRRMLHYPLEWHSWPTQICIRPTSEVELRLSR